MLPQDIVGTIQREIAQERQGRWTCALSEGKSPRLNPECAAPAEDHCLWQHLLHSAAAPQEPTREDMAAALERNELGDAELFQRQHEGQYVFDHSCGTWLSFGGVVWEDDVLRCAARDVMELAELYDDFGRRGYAYYAELRAGIEVEIADMTRRMTELETEADSEDLKIDKKRLKMQLADMEAQSATLLRKANAIKKSYEGRATLLRAMKRTEQVLKTAVAGKEGMGRTGKEFDQQPTLLACANGVIDLESGRLLRSAPGLYLTKASQYAYHGLHYENAWWEDHLRKVFCGNEDLLDYFEHCIGYSATGLRVNKDIYVGMGPHGDNGKSITFNAIKRVLGDMATTIKVDVLLEEKHRSRGPDPDLMVLDRLRMGVASEAPASCKFSMDRIKGITGDDDVRARGMYADSKIIESFVKLWLHTNDVPRVVGYDPAFMKRMRILPFMAQFVPASLADDAAHKYALRGKHEIDRELREAYPAILAWVVRCSRKFFLNMNFTAPSIVLQNTAKYFEDNDLVGKFIKCCCDTGDTCECQSKPLWKAFECWCVEEMGINQKSVISNIMLTKELEKRDIFRRIQMNPYVIWGGLKPNSHWKGRAL